MNVVVSTVGFAGDVLPFIRVGSRLKARGHHVTVISHCYYQPMAVRAGLDFVALDNIKDYTRLLEDGALLNTPDGISEFMRRHSLSRVPMQLDLISQRCRTDETILITRDMFDTAARISAEKLDIPVLWMFIAPSQLTTWKVRVELIRDQLGAEINALRTKIRLPAINDWGHWLGYPKCSIALWPSWFAAPDPSWPAGVVPVGFTNESQDECEPLPKEVQRVLNTGAPPILITGGTGMYLTSELFTVSSAACELLNRTAILVTPHERLVPTRLPQSVYWFRHLPFANLMPYVDAVIHHGGLGTAAYAIAGGVPQLILPYGADRPDNASRLQRLGVAEVQPAVRWNPDVVADTLQHLLTASTVRIRCQELALRLRDSGAMGAACELIEKASKGNRNFFMDRSQPTTATDYPTEAKPYVKEQNSDALSRIPAGLSQERLELLARLIRENGAGSGPSSKRNNGKKNTAKT
jgi:rhamnosyltransferase subunit B